MAVTGGILAHIRHAEQWLRRARSDYERGDVRRAVLRLLLAEAEIRQARDLGAAMDALPRRRSATLPWMILGPVAAAVLIVAVYAAVRPLAVGPAATGPRPVDAVSIEGRRDAVLQFQSGQVLPFVGFPLGVRPSPRAAPGPALGTGTDPLFDGADGPALVTYR